MDLAFDILQAVGLATAAGILAAALLLRWRSSGVLAAGAVAAGLVGVLAAGSDAHSYGQLIAALAGTVSHLTARLLLDGTRTRLEGSGAAGSLPIYGVVTALVVAGVSLAFAPLAVPPFLALVWFGVAARRRDQQKYAGLRILR